MPSPRDNYRDSARMAFLGMLAQTGNVSLSAKAAKLNKSNFYLLYKRDQKFAEAWDEAIRVSKHSLHDEALRRAVEGVQKPVYQGGKKVGTIREYSDTLLIFMIKLRDKEARALDNVTVRGDPDNPIRVKLDRDAIIGKLLGDRAPAPATGNPGAARDSE